MSTDSNITAPTLELIRESHPDISDLEDSASLSSKIFPGTSYNDPEKVETTQWLSSSHQLASPSSEDAAKRQERLGLLNIHLSTRTTLLGSKPSLADIAVYQSLAPQVKGWSTQERTGERGYSHIVRFVDFVEHSPTYGLQVPEDAKVNVNVDDIHFKWKPIDAKAEKEKKKKERAAAVAEANANTTAASTNENKDTASLPLRSAVNPLNPSNPTQPLAQIPAQEPPPADPLAPASQPQKKKEKKPKPPRQPAAAPPKETPLSPSLIDLRVGHILKAIPHPNADSLYVSTVACGDPQGTENTSEYEGQVVRTVCSGLNGLIPLEEMQGRKIVAVCNLKPVTMRGVKSAAMVLAASPRVKEGEDDAHKGLVELVDPPADAVAGERVWFEGWEGEPEGVLNPKKKVWETLAPGFGTGGEGEVKFEVGAVEPLKDGEGKDGRLVTKSGGSCRARTLKGATVR